MDAAAAEKPTRQQVLAQAAADEQLWIRDSAAAEEDGNQLQEVGEAKEETAVLETTEEEQNQQEEADKAKADAAEAAVAAPKSEPPENGTKHKRPFSHLEEAEQLILFTKIHRIEPATKKQKDSDSTELAPLFGTLPWSFSEEALQTTVDGDDGDSAPEEDVEDESTD